MATADDRTPLLSSWQAAKRSRPSSQVDGAAPNMSGSPDSRRKRQLVLLVGALVFFVAASAGLATALGLVLPCNSGSGGGAPTTTTTTSPAIPCHGTTTETLNCGSASSKQAFDNSHYCEAGEVYHLELHQEVRRDAWLQGLFGR